MPSNSRRPSHENPVAAQPTTDFPGLRPPGLGSGPSGPRPRACWPEALTARTGYAAAGYPRVFRRDVVSPKASNSSLGKPVRAEPIPTQLGATPEFFGAML